MNRLSVAERAQIIACLVEGNSIRSTARLTGAARNTITTLLVNLGEAVSEFQNRTLRTARDSHRVRRDLGFLLCEGQERARAAQG